MNNPQDTAVYFGGNFRPSAQIRLGLVGIGLALVLAGVVSTVTIRVIHWTLTGTQAFGRKCQPYTSPAIT